MISKNTFIALVCLGFSFTNAVTIKGDCNTGAFYQDRDI